MQRKFEQEAAQLIAKRKGLFRGYNVAICPVTERKRLVTVNPKWNCYCINLPADDRDEWQELTESALQAIWKTVGDKSC